MHTLADLALFVISDRESLRQDTLAIALGEILPARVAATMYASGASLRWFAADLTNRLESLGHCDRDRNHVFISRPSLCLLPTAGRPIAVLAGRRSSATVRDLTAAASALSNDFRIASIRPQFETGITRITVTASSVSALTRLADALNISFSTTPVSAILANVSGSLDEYENLLQWQRISEPNLPREDYDIKQMRFGRDLCDNSELHLSRYTNHLTQQRHYFVCKDSERAAVEPIWGRLLVLNRSGVAPLRFNSRNCTVEHSRWLPIPTLLRRSLTLCTGTAPVGWSEIAGDKYQAAGSNLLYSAVPRAIYEQVARKLGQRDI